MSIKFFYDAVTWRLRESGKIRSWLLNVARLEGFSIYNLNIVFVTDEAILSINKEFLGHDYYTDIITFDYSKSGELTGELYISIDSVRNNAAELGVTLKQEIARVMVHGLLHLVGYQDNNPENKKKMRILEDKYLCVLNNQV